MSGQTITLAGISLPQLREQLTRALDAGGPLRLVDGGGWLCRQASQALLEADEQALAAETLAWRALLARVNAVGCVAELRGPAEGIGAELALACAALAMGPEASLSFPNVARGAVPMAADRLVQRVGLGEALPLLLDGRPLPAAEAIALGLATPLASGEVVDPPRTRPWWLTVAESMRWSRRSMGQAALRVLTSSGGAVEVARATLDLIERQRRGYPDIDEAWSSARAAALLRPAARRRLRLSACRERLLVPPPDSPPPPEFSAWGSGRGWLEARAAARGLAYQHATQRRDLRKTGARLLLEPSWPADASALATGVGWTASSAPPGERPAGAPGLRLFPSEPHGLIEIAADGPAAAELAALARGLRAVPIVTRARACFVSDRLLAAYIGCALALVEAGLSCGGVIAAAERAGFVRDPFWALDLLALEALGDRDPRDGRQSPTALAAEGLARVRALLERHGERTDGLEPLIALRRQQATPEALFSLRWRGEPRLDGAAGRALDAAHPRKHADPEVAGAALSWSIALAGLACCPDPLPEPDALDLLCVTVTGYPMAAGGPCATLASLGREEATARLTTLADRFGARFDPARLPATGAAADPGIG